MKTKIYVATPVVSQQEIGMKFYFTSSPATGGTDTITFHYYNNFPSTATTSTITVPLLAVPSPYSNQQMASDFRSFVSLNSSLTAIYQEDTSYVSVYMNNGSPIINVVYSNPFGDYSPIIEDITTYNYNLLDLFNDENIEFTAKLSDIEKLSNVFTDFSNSFTIPATPNNSEILKHYYDVDIEEAINANIRLNGYIEIDGFPFRFGKIQLESVKLKNNRPDTYKITFFGGTVQLTDTFGEDTLKYLDYDKVITNNVDTYVKTRNVISQFDFEYNSTNFFKSLETSDFNNGDMITPMIAYADRDWNYGSNNAIDIATTTGAILDTELFQALRISKIIEAIEAKYNLSFSREFFGSATFNNLFMWLNGNELPLSEEKTINLEDALTDSGTWSGPNIMIDDFIQLDTVNDYITVFIPRIGTTVRDFADCEFWVRPLVYNLSDTNTQFKVIARNYETGEIIAESEIRTGDDTTSSPSIFMKFKQRNSDYTIKIKFTIQLYNTATFDFRVFINMFVTPSVTGPAYSDRVRQTLPNSQTIIANRSVSNMLPNMKVIDFLQGIMKQFKLIIRPLSGNQFYVNTLDGYYADGTILNVSEYIDNEAITVERPEIYKTIKFKYQKTNNVLGKKFRETYDKIDNEIGYGDLKALYSSIENKNELSVEVPFENMMFERLVVIQPSAKAGEITDWIIGQSITSSDNTTFSKNTSKPILFFYNGLVSNPSYPIKVKFGSDTPENIIYSHLIGNTNDELIDQVTDTINFGAEIDPWHGQIVANSLYLNYWSNWVNTIYDLKQRKFTYEGYLPPRFIEELSLNDRLIIGNNRYKINDYKVNLANGKTTLTLFNDIFEWNAYSFPTEFNYNERLFSPNGWYMTDTINNSDSAYIYGSFTGYNSSSYGRIIKLLPNLDVDTSFNTGTGFNNNSFGFQSIYKQPDGKLLVTGDFTSFNGSARNCLTRINTDGSLDTSLVIGSGFNNITSGVEVDSQGRIIICGSYSSYSGITSQRLIRLDSGGTVHTSTGTNGFDGVTNSVVINSDDSMYIGGYFSSYSGVSSNRLIKLTSGFTVDSTFNVGTGLNSNTSTQPVGLISDGSDGVYVFGHFTTYSGISQNRFTKLGPTGQIDPDFKVNFGTGFNASVTSAYKVLEDKLLIYGTFTEFNGLSVSNGLIVLNPNGSIYRTFNGNYVNVFTIGDRFYGNTANANTVLIDDEASPILSSYSIIANAGLKYFSVNILKNVAWSASTVDLGYGTDWVTITTPSGTTSSEFVFRVEDKTNQTAPDLYQPRYMTIRFNFDGILRDVLITQNGLQE